MNNRAVSAFLFGTKRGGMPYRRRNQNRLRKPTRQSTRDPAAIRNNHEPNHRSGTSRTRPVSLHRHLCAMCGADYVRHTRSDTDVEPQLMASWRAVLGIVVAMLAVYAAFVVRAMWG
jgi:hypothetical protein